MMRAQRLRMFPDPPEDDGLVCIRGHLVQAWWAEENARHHLEGFDTLPKAMRDQINYATTPEEGARPVRDLVDFDAKKHALAEIRYRLRIKSEVEGDL